MKNAVRMGALIAIAAATVAGCSAENGSGTTTSTTTGKASATAAQPSAGQQPPATQAPGATQATEAPAPATEAPAPVTEAPAGTSAPGTTAPNPAPADDISGPGRCIDPASTGVQNALSRLGGSWVASQASADRPGNCGELLWVRAVGGNSAGAPIHILFFSGGKWLGTATSEAYAFTYVTGASGNAVTVDYKWLVADEPFAAPQGGPATITYTWTGSKLTMSAPLPTEVTQPHR
ncbi:LppP/LprE family lipoprotein [Nocardia sp. NPDC057663]|uniref:LppP/LprE family lipoprotein n=1 Tax=Nocardia sp. NPDC057663 TaxID=3346201 RepID=UPI00366CC38C